MQLRRQQLRTLATANHFAFSFQTQKLLLLQQPKSEIHEQQTNNNKPQPSNLKPQTPNLNPQTANHNLDSRRFNAFRLLLLLLLLLLLNERTRRGHARAVRSEK